MPLRRLEVYSLNTCQRHSIYSGVEVYCGHRDQLIYLQIYILLPSRQQSEIPKKATKKLKYMKTSVLPKL